MVRISTFLVPLTSITQAQNWAMKALQATIIATQKIRTAAKLTQALAAPVLSVTLGVFAATVVEVAGMLDDRLWVATVELIEVVENESAFEAPVVEGDGALLAGALLALILTPTLPHSCWVNAWTSVLAHAKLACLLFLGCFDWLSSMLETHSPAVGSIERGTC